MDEDVKRIVDLGYEEHFFVAKSEGFKVLKNSKEGRCVFHDGSGCTIYESRPLGCRSYPIVFNEESMSAVRDEFCPFRSEFTLPKTAKRELTEIYSRLLDEKSNSSIHA